MMSESKQSVTRLSVHVAEAIATAAETFFHLQRPDGSWLPVPQAAPAATAAAVIALHVADPADSAEMIEAGVRWLRAAQGVSGGWGDAPGGPPTLVATALAAAALHLLAREASASEVTRALGWIEGRGGAAALSDRDPLHLVCLTFLAEAGLMDPDRAPFVPTGMRLPSALRHKASPAASPLITAWRILERRTRRDPGLVGSLLSHRAEDRALGAIDQITPHHGPKAGAHGSPLLAALHCFALSRAGVRPDLVERMVAFLWLSMCEDGSWPIERDLEVAASTRIVLGLHEAGYAGDRRLARAMDWISDTQWWTRCAADGSPPGGWSRSVDSGWPDAATTSDALLSLVACGYDVTDSDIADGVNWLLCRQNKDGSWNCCGYGDERHGETPCAVAASRAVRALRRARLLTTADRPIARAVRRFARTQLPDGSFTCPGFRGGTVATAHVLEALGALGLRDSETAHRARRWLLARQNDDGGWGDGGEVASTVEETSWALMGLIGAGLNTTRDPWPHRAAEFLVQSQLESGLWASSLVAVRSFGMRYRDDLTASGCALQALGRYRGLMREV